jgi:hypothetical protein
MDGRAVDAHSVGQVELAEGSELATSDGRVEILLTPGVFLRLGENSTVKMVSPKLLHTEIMLERGQAQVEVDLLHDQNQIQIDEQSGQALLLKPGLYAFDADAHTMKVLDGEAAAYQGDQKLGKATVVKKGREVALAGEPAKPQKFNEKQAQADPLYAWGDARDEALGQASETVAADGGPGVYGPGWAWAPGLYGYTWLPGYGAYWSPFGYGFYSPFWYGGGFGYGFGGYGYRGGYLRGGGYRGVYGGGRGGVTRPVGGSSGFHGGGFQGGGGFHGGGGGSRGGGGGGHR